MPASPPAPSARPGTRRRLSAARRRDLILRAAAGVFAEHGYHGASMMAIAAAAGIAPSVIHDHFSSKKALHLELLTQHAAAMVEATTRLPAGGNGEDLVHRSTEAFFALRRGQPVRLADAIPGPARRRADRRHSPTGHRRHRGPAAPHSSASRWANAIQRSRASGITVSMAAATAGNRARIPVWYSSGSSASMRNWW